MGSDFKDIFGDWRPDDDDRASSERSSEPERRPDRSLNEKEVRVVNVYEIDNGHGNESTIFILLRDNIGREFKIFVKRDVAYAISMAIGNETPDRPFTHDLMKTVMERTGASVERITIDDLWQDTFYAKISIVTNGISQDIDSRPSDALAMAIRFRAPIYVAESVLESTQIP